MEIEPYRELSTFTKLLQTAMLEHDPDKPVEIMDFLRTFETPLDKAKWLINDFAKRNTVKVLILMICTMSVLRLPR